MFVSYFDAKERSLKSPETFLSESAMYLSDNKNGCFVLSVAGIENTEVSSCYVRKSVDSGLAGSINGIATGIFSNRERALSHFPASEEI